jgi:hypothetical protein
VKLGEDRTVLYTVKKAGQIGGPYTLEGLESLVYLGKLTPDDLIAREGLDAFVAVRESELARTLFPRLQAKPSPRAWGRPGQADRHDLKEFKFGENKFEKVNSAPDLPGRIDVKDLLQEVRQAERDAGRDVLKPDRFRISRRNRDFWLVFIIGNALFYGGAFYMQNTVSWVFAIAGSGLFSWGLLWSMFGVMGRY